MSTCLNRTQILDLVASGSPEEPSLRSHVHQCVDCQRQVAKVLAVFRLAGHMEAFLSGARESVPADVAQRIGEYAASVYHKRISSRTTCPDVSLLIAFSANSEAVEDRVQNHVQKCTACQQTLDHLRSLRHLAGSYEAFCAGTTEEVPTDMFNRVFERADAKFKECLASTSNCPSRDQLISLLAGEAHSGVRDHVQQCPTCKSAVAKLFGVFRLAAATEKFSSDFFKDDSESIPDSVATRIFARVDSVLQQRNALPEPCPDRDRIVALIAGSEDAPEVRSHVEKCDACSQTVARLLGALCFGGPLLALDAEVNPDGGDTEKMPQDMHQRIFASVNRAYQDEVSPPSTQEVREELTVAAEETPHVVQPAASPDARMVRVRGHLRSVVPYASAASLLLAAGIHLYSYLAASRISSAPVAVRKAERETSSFPEPMARDELEAGNSANGLLSSVSRIRDEFQSISDLVRELTVRMQDSQMLMALELPELRIDTTGARNPSHMTSQEEELAECRRWAQVFPELRAPYEELSRHAKSVNEAERYENMARTLAAVNGVFSRGLRDLEDAIRESIDTDSTDPLVQGAKTKLFGQGIHAQTGREIGRGIARRLGNLVMDPARVSVPDGDAARNSSLPVRKFVMNDAIDAQNATKSPEGLPASAQTGFSSAHQPTQ